MATRAKNFSIKNHSTWGWKTHLVLNVLMLTIVCHQVNAVDSNAGLSDYKNVADYMTRLVRYTFPPDASMHNTPWRNPQLPATENSTQGAKFISPGYEILIEHMVAKPKIIQGYDGEIFIDTGGELLRIVNSNGKFELQTVFRLESAARSSDTAVMLWKTMYIMVVAADEHCDVYGKTVNSHGAGVQVQKIKFPSEDVKKSRFFVKNDELYLLVYTLTKETGNFRLLKWIDNQFAPQHELELTTIDDLFVYRSENDTLVLPVSYARQSGFGKKSLVGVYHLHDGKLVLLQQLFVQSNILHFFTLNRKCYLLQCSTKNVCFVHKYRKGKFTKVFQVNRKFTKTTKIISSERLIAVQFPDEFAFYQQPTLTSAVSDAPMLENLVKVLFYTTPSQPDKTYIGLFHMSSRGFHVRFLEVDVTQVQQPDTVATAHHHHTIDSAPVKHKLNALRKYLESRAPIVHDIAYAANDVLRTDKSARISSMRVHRYPLYVASGNVENLSVICSGEGCDGGGVNATSGDVLREIAWLVAKTSELKGLMGPLQSSARRHKRQREEPVTEIIEDDEEEKEGQGGMRMTKHYRGDKLICKNIRFDGPHFKRLLRRNRDNIFPNFSQLNNIRAKSVRVRSNTINQIGILYVMRTEEANSGFTFRRLLGNKRFDNVTVKNMEANFLNGVEIKKEPGARAASFRGGDGAHSHEDTTTMTLQGNIGTSNLQVDTINGLPWREIVDGTQFNGVIEGNLIVTRPMKVDQLVVGAVNDIAVSDLMTVNTDQHIHSSIAVTSFKTESIMAEQVNGITLKTDAALHGKDNHIKSHVVISNMNVTRILTLPEDDIVNGHIVGSTASDSMQHYLEPVVIRGSLTINNLRTLPQSTVLVNNLPFNPNVGSKYWLNNVAQTIPYFKFHNIVKASRVSAHEINAHPASDYLILHRTPPHAPAKLVFKYATIHGNLQTGDPKTQLARISRDAVRFGESVTVTGTIRFKEEVTVGTLVTPRINNQETSNLVHRHVEDFHFRGTKKVNDLGIYGQVSVKGKFDVQNFNGTDFGTFFEKAIRLDRPIEVQTLVIDSAKIQSLNVDVIQDIAFNNFIGNISSVLSSSTSVRNIKLSHDAFFESSIHVETINDVPVDEYFAALVRKDNSPDGPIPITGTKTFNAGLVVNGDVRMKSLNTYNLHVWQEKALRIAQHQVIKGHWTIETLKTQKLHAKVINGVDTNNFLLRDQPNQVIYGDLHVEKLNVGNLVTNLPIEDISHYLTHPITGTIGTLVVDGPLYYPMEFKSKFTDILTDSVSVDGEQSIHGRVTFINRPTFESIKCKMPLVNNIDPFGIHADALKYKGEKQIVYASKKFLHPLETKFMIVKIKFDVPVLNNIDIMALNNSIVRRNEDSYLYGKKIFTVPPVIGTLYVDGVINGIPLDTIAFIQDPKMLQTVSFENLQVISELIVERVNSHPLSDFITKRARLHGPGQELDTVTFQNLVIAGELHAQTINKLRMDDLVMLQTGETQVIDGTKEISRVIIDGPSSCLRINGVDFLDFVKYNVKTDTSEVIPKLVGRVNVNSGIEITGTFNGKPIQAVMNPQPKSFDAEVPVPEVKAIVQNAQELVQGKTNKRFLYLDYAKNIHTKFVNDEFDQIPGPSFVMDAECPRQVQVKLSSSLAPPNATLNIRKNINKSNIIQSNGMQIEVEGENCMGKSLKITTHDNGNTGGVVSVYEPHFKVEYVEIIGNYPQVKMIVMHGEGQMETAVPTKSPSSSSSSNWVKRQALGNGVTAIKVLTFETHTLLVLAKSTEVELMVLRDEWFEPLEAITGSYNMISDPMVVDGEVMLAFGLRNSKTVTIYKLVENGENPPLMPFFQKIRLDEMRIKAIKAFVLNGKSHLTLITSTGHFDIYRYTHINGWTVLTSSFLENMQSITEFEYMNREYLLVISATKSPAIIRMYQQS